MVKDEQKQNDKAAADERIFIIAQAFYGNRTGTYMTPSGLDRFIWGCLRNEEPNEQFREGRKIVPLPESESLVIIYNEHQEKRVRMDRAKYAEEFRKEHGSNYTPKPTAVIPELNLEIYSRCIVCRQDPDGVFKSLEKEDGKIFSKYLSE